ncbi:hypothetical protein HDV01_000642 [Terramyces sp. JEL0728]|nr:hypothetical protein HDV01_000642 [Terramyces sp. JEL0728]
MKLFTKKTSSVEPEGNTGSLKRAITTKEGKRGNDDENEILSSPSVLSKGMVFDFTSTDTKEHKKTPSANKFDSTGNIPKDLETSKSPKSVRAASKDYLAMDSKQESQLPNLGKNRMQIDSPANKTYTPPLPLENEDSILDDSKIAATKSKMLKGVTVRGLEKLQFNTQYVNKTEYSEKIATVIDSPNTAEEGRTDRIRASIGSSPLVDRGQDPFAKKELSNLKIPITSVKILEDIPIEQSSEIDSNTGEVKSNSFKTSAKSKDTAEKMQSPIDKAPASNFMQIDIPAAKYKPPPPLEDNSFVIETTSNKSSPAVVKNKAKGITIRGIEKLQFDVSQPISLTDPTTSSADTKILPSKAAVDNKRQSFPVSIADTVSIPSAGIRETDQFIFDEIVLKNSSIKEDNFETDTLDKTPLISPVCGKNPFSSNSDLGTSNSTNSAKNFPTSASNQFNVGTFASKSSINIIGNSGVISPNASQTILSPKPENTTSTITKSPSMQNAHLQKSPSSQNTVGISKSPSNQINSGVTKSPSNQINSGVTKSPSNQVNAIITKSPSNPIAINLIKSPSVTGLKTPEIEPVVNSKPTDAAVLKREESFKHRKSVGSRPSSGIFDPPKFSDKSFSEAFKPAAGSSNVLNTSAESQDTRLAISVVDLDTRKQSITSALSSHPSTANSSRNSVGPESARSIKNFQMQIDKPKMALYPPPLIEEESTPEDGKNKAPDFKMKGITVRGLENFHVDTKLAVKSSSESELKAMSPAIKSSSSEDEEGQTLGKQKKKSKPSLAKIPIVTAPPPELVRENSDGPRTALISEIPNPFSDSHTGQDATEGSSTLSPQQNRVKKPAKERRNSKVAQYIAELKIDTIEEKPEMEKSKSNIAAWLDGTIAEVKESKASLASPRSNPDFNKSCGELSYLLPKFMSGVRVAFDNSISKDTKRLLSRHLIAYDGEVHEKISENTTHYCSADVKKNLDILLNFPAILLEFATANISLGVGNQIYVYDSHYRKAGKKDKGGLYRPKSLQGMPSKSQLLYSSPSLFGSTKALNTQEQGLEPEEIDDEDEEREAMIKEMKIKEENLKNDFETVKKEHSELLEEIRQLKERYTLAKDSLNGEIIATKQKFDAAAAQIDEQLAIHTHIESSIQKSQALRSQDAQRIKELEQKLDVLHVETFTKQIADLQTKVSRLTADLKSESIEKQALIGQQTQLKEAMKVAVQRSSSLEQEVDSLKLLVDGEAKGSLSNRKKSDAAIREEQERIEYIAQMESQVKMLKIAVETKDANTETLYQKIKAAELTALKHTEQYIATKEKHDLLEQISMRRAHDIIHALQDELAECKNAMDRKDQKIKSLSNENKNLQERLVQLEAESSKWNEFANIVDQVESSGANYLAMMQGVKSKLGRV